MLPDSRIAVIGGRSLIGTYLLPRLVQEGATVVALTRKALPYEPLSKVAWRHLPGQLRDVQWPGPVNTLINLSPLVNLLPYLQELQPLGVRRLVTYSTTSLFSKRSSGSLEERRMVTRLQNAEEALRQACEVAGIGWTILRCTIIYGDLQARDWSRVGTGLATIVRWVARTGTFPLVGAGQGLRQPVHVDDLAQACISALQRSRAVNHAYNLSGGETLTYRQMVERIGRSVGRSTVFLPVPLWLLRGSLELAKRLPPYRFLNAEMANRMNLDLVFEHLDAQRDLGFSPRAFLAAKAA